MELEAKVKFLEEQLKKFNDIKINCMGKFMKDPEKPYRTDWENLKVGDYVFDDVRGPASSSGQYGSGSLVTKITDKHIYTKFYDVSSWKKDKWDITSKYHIGPPTAYFLSRYQSN